MVCATAAPCAGAVRFGTLASQTTDVLPISQAAATPLPPAERFPQASASERFPLPCSMRSEFQTRPLERARKGLRYFTAIPHPRALERLDGARVVVVENPVELPGQVRGEVVAHPLRF